MQEILREGGFIMKIIDLTHTISEDMPVYPGTEPPVLKQANTYERDGFKETLLSMYSHTGTHVDPPAHLFADRTTLDALPIEQFAGKALVVDCTHLTIAFRKDRKPACCCFGRNGKSGHRKSKSC